ncbi:MAG: hypothetical protein NTY74_12530 [Ignavibacteriae bacterium]|nr:hypothetical protein [Ignavibacteriota bacterium]
MLRFDDLIREERYFSATILPYLLSYDDFNGLKVFFEYLNKKTLSVNNNDISVSDFQNSLSSLQLITEPNVERDLSHYKIEIPSESFSKKKLKQSKPDLLIIYESWALLFEIKLFSKYSEYSLNEQMLEQSYILDIVTNLSEGIITNIKQIAICPYDYVLKSFELITWKEIYDIYRNIIPDDNYFYKRLDSAISRI